MSHASTDLNRLRWSLGDQHRDDLPHPGDLAPGDGAGVDRPPLWPARPAPVADVRPLGREAFVGGPECARRLVGACVVRTLAGPDRALTAWWQITATEYYGGSADWPDEASYAQRRLAKGKPMWGLPGRVYYVQIRGPYWGFNVVAEPAGVPGAILITGVELVLTVAEHGLAASLAERLAVRGPHKVKEALGIHAGLEGHDLTEVGELFLALAARPRRASDRGSTTAGAGDSAWHLARHAPAGRAEGGAS